MLGGDLLHRSCLRSVNLSLLSTPAIFNTQPLVHALALRKQERSCALLFSLNAMNVYTKPHDIVKAFIKATYPATAEHLPTNVLSRYAGVIVFRAIMRYLESEYDSYIINNDLTTGFGKERFPVFRRVEMEASDYYRDLVRLTDPKPVKRIRKK